MGFIIIIVTIISFVILGISIYNGLVKKYMQTQEAWSQIDVQLKRRNDLLPTLLETVKGYGRYEQETLEKIADLRSQVLNATSPAETLQISDALSRQLSGIFAVAENYPDLKASTSYMQLQEELVNTENKISYSRQLYNSVTANYNESIATFPSSLIAGTFGFKEASFLKTPEAEKTVPGIHFDSNSRVGD